MHKPIYTSHEIGYDKDASINYFHDGTNNKFIDDKKYLVTSTKGKEITDDIDIELGYRDFEWRIDVYKLNVEEVTNWQHQKILNVWTLKETI